MKRLQRFKKEDKCHLVEGNGDPKKIYSIYGGQVSLTHFYLDRRTTFGKQDIDFHQFMKYNTCFENILGKTFEDDVKDLWV